MPELSWPRRIAVAVIDGVVGVPFLLWLVWGRRPDSLFGWVAFVAVLVVASMLGNALAYYALHNPVYARITARTADEPVSSARIGYLLAALLGSGLLLALVMGIWYVLNSALGSS